MFSNKKFKNYKNSSVVIRKISITSLFLTLTLILSFIEINVTLPYGGEYDFRLLDMVFLFLSLSIIGLRYSVILATLQPWLHFMIDGDHLPISIFFYSLSSVINIIIFWIFHKYLVFSNSDNNFFNKKYWHKILIIFSLITILSLSDSTMDLFSLLTTIKLNYNYKDYVKFISNYKNIFIIFNIILALAIVKFILTIILFFNIKNRIQLTFNYSNKTNL